MYHLLSSLAGGQVGGQIGGWAGRSPDFNVTHIKVLFLVYNAMCNARIG